MTELAARHPGEEVRLAVAGRQGEDQCLGGHLPKRVFDSIIGECSVGSGLNRCNKLERKRSFRGDDPPLGVAVNVRAEFVERRRCRQQLRLFDPVRGSDERRLDHQQEECLVGQVVGSCGSDGDQHAWSSPRVSCTALGFILVGPDRSGFRRGADATPVAGGESPHPIALDDYFATFGSSFACAAVRSSTTRSLWR